MDFQKNMDQIWTNMDRSIKYGPSGHPDNDTPRKDKLYMESSLDLLLETFQDRFLLGNFSQGDLSQE